MPEFDDALITDATAPPDPDWAEPAPVPWTPPPRTRLRALDLAVLLAILLASGVGLFARLGEPGALLSPSDEQCTKFPPLPGAQCYEPIPLDEVHYIPDARDVIRFGTDSDTRITGDDGAFVVHPPVAKWFIALGMKIFGDRPFGWRFFSAVFGLLGVLVMYLLALRLWGSPWWAAMAATLLALDGLWFVQSRIAMLDIFAAVFVLTGVWCLVEDRDRPLEARVRWWRLGAGLAFGFALGSKWQIGPLLVVAVLLSAAWDRARARRIVAEDGSVRRLSGAAAALVLLPVLVYVASYTPWFVDQHRYDPPLCAGRGSVATRWICYQKEVLSFHRGLAKYDEGKPAHPYFGHGYSWPWIGRPVAHAYEVRNAGTPEERRMEVLGIPNPLVWWTGFFLAFPLVLFWAIRRRDDVAPLVASMFAAGFVPYMLFDAVRRPVFLFYATPMVPYLVLAVVYGFWRLSRRAPSMGAFAVAFTALAAVVMLYLYPVLAAWPVSPSGFWGWEGRIWLTADCTAETIKRFCWI